MNYKKWLIFIIIKSGKCLITLIIKLFNKIMTKILASLFNLLSLVASISVVKCRWWLPTMHVPGWDTLRLWCTSSRTCPAMSDLVLCLMMRMWTIRFTTEPTGQSFILMRKMCCHLICRSHVGNPCRLLCSSMRVMRRMW